MRATRSDHLILFDLIALIIFLEVTKLIVMQLSPASCHFLPLRYKYSSQHPAVKHPQSTPVSKCDRLILNILILKFVSV
jgi:hypothetical protein